MSRRKLRLKAARETAPSGQSETPRVPTTTGRDRWIYLILFLAAFFVYSPVRQFDFVSLDDPQEVAANPHVRGGLTGPGIEWALTSGEYANWFPLTRLTHLIDS